MDSPSQKVLDSLKAAVSQPGSADTVVRWQSTFGLILIEVRGGAVFVNGEVVQPAMFGGVDRKV